MNGYNFTERVRKALADARAEAARLGQQYVATEHILLGMTIDGKGVACDVLRNLNVDLGTLRTSIERNMKPGDRSPKAPADFPYTSRAKKALESAMAEARGMGHTYVGTEHILLGLIRDSDSIAGKVLTEFDVAMDNARAEVLRVVGPAPMAPDDAPGRAAHATPLSAQPQKGPRRPHCIDCRVPMNPFSIVINIAERTPIEAYCCPRCGVLRMFAPLATA